MTTLASVDSAIECDPFARYWRESIPGVAGLAAGLPNYPADFARDTITSGVLAARADILVSGLETGAYHQAKEDDLSNGAERGKIAHEKPGARLDGREGQTDYNACDTTPLFLIAAEGLSRIDKLSATQILQAIHPNLEMSVEYILDHIEDDMFIERPPKGATGFTLKATMWKDSILPHPGKEEPTYPVIYSQAHFVAARGLLAASQLLQEPELGDLADRMFRRGIAEFIRLDGYVVYKDNEETLTQPSSDELHSLAYIPPQYTELLPLAAIKARAHVLETPFGYMCTPYNVAKDLSDDYHANSVWTQDNGLIHYGAVKFGLDHEAAVASSVSPHIGEGQELFKVEVDKSGNMLPIRKGNQAQLWAVATSEYFKGQSSLLNQPWL